MCFDAGDAEPGHAALAGAEDVTFAAQLEIFLGNTEAVLSVAHHIKACFGSLTERGAVDQEAARALAAATDATAQLMKLSKPEALGMLDHHDTCLRNIDANLNDRGGDEQARLAGGKARHGAILVGALHAAVHKIDAGAEMAHKTVEPLLRGG